MFKSLEFFGFKFILITQSSFLDLCEEVRVEVVRGERGEVVVVGGHGLDVDEGLGLGYLQVSSHGDQ